MVLGIIQDKGNVEWTGKMKGGYGSCLKFTHQGKYHSVNYFVFFSRKDEDKSIFKTSQFHDLVFKNKKKWIWNKKRKYF